MGCIMVQEGMHYTKCRKKYGFRVRREALLYKIKYKKEENNVALKDHHKAIYCISKSYWFGLTVK